MALSFTNIKNASLGRQLLLLLGLFLAGIVLQLGITLIYSFSTAYNEEAELLQVQSQMDEVIDGMTIDDLNSAHMEIVKAARQIGSNISSSLKSYLLFMQIGYNVICFLIVGIFYRKAMNTDFGQPRDLNIRFPILLFASVFLYLAALPFLGLSTELNEMLGLKQLADNFGFDYESSALRQMLLTYAIFTPDSGLDHVLMFSGIAIFPALGEELLFRGGMQKQMHKKGGDPHWAIFITALVFSLLHMDLMAFFYRFLLGVLLGYAYFWSGSIWPSIVIHFCNNALTYFALFLFDASEVESGMLDNTGNFVQLLMGAFSMALLLYLFHQLYQRRISEGDQVI